MLYFSRNVSAIELKPCCDGGLGLNQATRDFGINIAQVRNREAVKKLIDQIDRVQLLDTAYSTAVVWARHTTVYYLTF